MTTSAPAYKAPDGFYKSYMFDKTGQVFADGKALSGVQLDVKGLKDPTPQLKNPFNGSFYNNTAAPVTNSYALGGGSISRLSIDDKGNLVAEIGAPTQTTAKPTGVGTYGLGILNNQQPNLPYGLTTQKAQTALLSGIGLDPARTSSNAGDQIGANDAYLRTERDGLYFAQVNKGADTVAYGYSKFQDASSPVAGPAQPTAGRRQGGNAGGGVSVDGTAISLLGN